MQGNGIQRLFEHNRSASKPTNESAEPVADNSTPDDEALDKSAMNAETLPRPANKILPRLHIMKNNGDVFTMIYHELASNATFSGGAFTLLFAGAKNWEVIVKGSGPNFWKVYDYVTLGRWPFIVEATRGFKSSDADTVFDEITIRDVTPKD